MTCNEIFKYFEDWAPKEISWQKDNVGLQVGSGKRKVTNILLSLELTDKVVEDAIKKNCNLIITHHPLLFHSLKKIDTFNDKSSRLIEKLIKNDITLYSAHTNLDFTKDGVSFELAKILNLKKINFLVNLKSNQNKLTVFVPLTHVNQVSKAIFEAGGGIIGEYSSCSFRTPGKGTFKGSGKTNPLIGKKENYEEVEEIKLEVLVNSWKLRNVLNELIKVHPYEEIAYDIYPLENYNVNYGAGAIGELERPLSRNAFLSYISKKLNIKNFRFTEGRNTSIRKVAVCGGSGSDLIRDAISSGADAFITADIKYHSFHDSNGEILLIDAGHYETEIHSLKEVKKKLTNYINSKNTDIKIFRYNGSTNPIIFFNN
jgi:dinuclear metal center YbgI/SA1388 family protein